MQWYLIKIKIKYLLYVKVKKLFYNYFIIRKKIYI